MKKRLFIGSAILVSIFMAFASASAPIYALNDRGAGPTYSPGAKALQYFDYIALYKKCHIDKSSSACETLSRKYPNGNPVSSSDNIFGTSTSTSSTPSGASGDSSTGSTPSTTTSGGSTSDTTSSSGQRASRDIVVPDAGGEDDNCVETAILRFGGDEVCDDGRGQSIIELLKLIVDIMTIGVGILGVIGITIAGIQYLTAGGSEEKTRKAKRRIFEIVIGLVAYALFYVILTWLNISPPSA